MRRVDSGETAGTDESHADLLKQLHAGNEKAVRILFAMHYRPLCYFAFSILHDRQEAEDLAVGSFLKFLQRKSHFDNLPDIKSFLFTATKNACIDFLRKQKARERRLNQDALAVEVEEKDFDQEMITAQLLQSVYEEIENLPGKCKTIFKSFFLDGKNTVTIAKEMGLKQQTVLNQKAKAQRILRSILLRKGVDYVASTAVLAILSQ